MEKSFFITDEEFRLITDLIRQKSGINLGEQKRALVIGRLSSTLKSLNIEKFSDYYKLLLDDESGVALTNLLNKITTNHTFFLRERQHFDFFKNDILPKLATKREKDIRIWSAGCSRGHEPYTLAMIIDEFFGIEKKNWRCDILSTDISEKVLNDAKNGLYSKEEVSNLPKMWLYKYFNKKGEHYEVIDSLKKELVIRKFNLLTETFPFKKPFDVIFCRNVMIYFNDETKISLINRFHSSLVKGGYLFIGLSESLRQSNTDFKYLGPGTYVKTL